MTRHSNRRRTPAGPARGGFTLVELLIVFVILAILIALLLPAINGAVRTAKNAAVTANLKQLDAALAAFKSKYGEYPPSRIILWEDGYFRINDQTPLAASGGSADMTVGQLAQRSLAIMRKFFPKAVFSSSGAVWVDQSQWYDFNGDRLPGGVNASGSYSYSTPIILQGHQCLTFFLGGLPYNDQTNGLGFSMTGFARNPANPFTPSIAPGGVVTDPVKAPNFSSQNREAPLFEFASERLLDPSAVLPTSSSIQVGPNDVYSAYAHVPGYMDTLGNSLSGSQINFIAYFSAYGNNAYDPNDVNFAIEADGNNVAPIRASFGVRFPVRTSDGNTAQAAVSPVPNPYCSSTTTAAVVNFINPQTYQLISSGVDGQFGPGGQFNSSATSGTLPYNASWISSTDQSVRQREQDNLTNFRGGRLD